MKKLYLSFFALFYFFGAYSQTDPTLEWIEINGTKVNVGSTFTINNFSLGNEFYIEAEFRNNGDDSPAGYNNITFSFPEFTSSSDKSNVRIGSRTSSDMNDNYVELIGSEALGGDKYANYLVIESTDENTWDGDDYDFGDRDNNLEVYVKPDSYGIFEIKVRAAASNQQSWTSGWTYDPNYGTNDCLGFDAYSVYVDLVAPEDYWITSEAVSKSTVEVGEQFDISCRQYSNGLLSNDKDVYVGYFLSTNTSYGSSDIPLGEDDSSIGNDPYDPESQTVSIPGGTSPGNYYILFYSDYNNACAETNENNNIEAVPITVTATPDLDIVSHAILATSAQAGGSINWNCTVNNIGNSRAARCKLKLYISSSSSTFGTNDIASANIQQSSLYGLDAGASQFIQGSLTIPSSLSEGTYYIHFLADADDQVSPELSESNNHDFMSIEILPALKPDVVVSAIWTDPLNPKVGESVDLYARITNNGEGLAENIIWNYYINGTPVGSDTHSSLDAGASREESCTGYTFSQAGEFLYEVGIEAVPNESEPNNNSKSAYITVEPNLTQTRFNGSLFIDKIAKYGVPIRFDAKLESDEGLYWSSLNNKAVHFEIFYDNTWHEIQDDGISETSFSTNNGIASVYFTAPNYLLQTTHYIRARFDGDENFAPASIQRTINIHKPKWLFMVYVNCDNDLEPLLSSIYNDLYTAKDHNDVSISILIDRASGSNHHPEYSDELGITDFEDARYIRLTNEGSIFNTWGEVNMGNQTTLSNFISLSQEECLADNHCLIFNSHGNGWGVERQYLKSASASSIKEFEQIRNTPELEPMQTVNYTKMGAICPDYSSYEIDDVGSKLYDKLTLKEIRNALPNNINILALEGCEMATVEVMAEFQDKVDYLVASEIPMNAQGFDYTSILDKTSSDNLLHPMDLAKSFVNTFSALNTNGDLTIGCWNLTNYETLRTYIESFSQNLIDLLPFDGTRQLLYNVYNQTGGSEDLKRIVDAIISSTINDELIQSCNSLSNYLEDTDFRIAWNSTFDESFGGLSIYLLPPPPHNTFENLNPGYFTELQFSSDPNQKWDDFLKLYYDVTLPSLSFNSNFSGWYSGDIIVSVNAHDGSDILYTEFQYSLNQTSWFQLKSPESSDGKDWLESNGWQLTFKTNDFPDIGAITSQNAWIRVRACDKGGNISDWIESNYFSIDNISPLFSTYANPIELSPSNISLLQSVVDNHSGIVDDAYYPSFYIGWNREQVSPTNYSDIIIGNFNGQFYEANFTVSNSHIGDRLYWRVKAIDSAGNVSWSEIHDAGVVDMSTLNEHQTINSGVSLFPNPTDGIVSLNFNRNINSEITIEVFNASGKIVIEKQLDHIQANQPTSINLDKCNYGLYFIRISSSEFNKMLKVLKK